MQLTAEQRDHYWTKGWLVVDGVVAADAIMNIAGVVIMGLVFWRIGAFRKKPAATPEEPEHAVAPVR